MFEELFHLPIIPCNDPDDFADVVLHFCEDEIENLLPSSVGRELVGFVHKYGPPIGTKHRFTLLLDSGYTFIREPRASSFEECVGGNNVDRGEEFRIMPCNCGFALCWKLVCCIAT